MRKCVILLLWCLCSTIYAQDTFESVLREGLTWRMKYQSHALPDRDFTYWCENMVLQGDTIVDNIHFKRAYRQTLSDAGEYILGARGYWIGQKDGVVYQYEENEDWNQKYYPIMDFSLNVGDEFSMYDEDPYDDEQQVWEIEKFRVVAVTDTVLVGSTDKRSRRCIRVQHILSKRSDDYWVEGIGSLKSGIIGRKEYYPDSGTLERCTYGSEVLYFLDSIVGIDEILTHKSSANGFHDLQGRSLNAQPSKGLYIQNGKKYVTK